MKMMSGHFSKKVTKVQLDAFSCSYKQFLMISCNHVLHASLWDCNQFCAIPCNLVIACNYKLQVITSEFFNYMQLHATLCNLGLHATTCNLVITCNYMQLCIVACKARSHGFFKSCYFRNICRVVEISFDKVAKSGFEKSSFEEKDAKRFFYVKLFVLYEKKSLQT